MRPSIEDLKEIQKSTDLLGAHIVYLDHQGFVMAHTELERLNKDQVPLASCKLHQWLSDKGNGFRVLGATGGGYFIVNAAPEGASWDWSWTVLEICDR